VVFTELGNKRALTDPCLATNENYPTARPPSLGKGIFECLELLVTFQQTGL
jgi:hypothetical protein